MPTLEQKLRWRELILADVYDRSGGDPLNGPELSEVIEGIYGRFGYRMNEEPTPETFERVDEELGVLNGKELEHQIVYLEGEVLVQWDGHQVVLTHEGVRHVEERAGGGEAAAVLPALLIREVETFLAEVQRKRDDLGLSADDEQALDANLVSAEAQIKSPKPNRGIVRAAVGAISWFLKNAAAGAAGQGLYVGATVLLGKI